MSRVSGKPYFVYVLWSAGRGVFYTGVSEDPQKRLYQHNNSGKGWSARYRPWSLVYTQRFENYTEARKRELELKAQKGGRGFLQRTGLRAQPFAAGS